MLFHILHCFLHRNFSVEASAKIRKKMSLSGPKTFATGWTTKFGVGYLYLFPNFLGHPACMYVILEFFAQNWFRTIYNSSLKSRLYSHFVFSQVEYHLLPLLWLNLVQLVPYCHIALFILKLAPIIIKTLFCFKKLTCSCLYDHRRTWFVFCGHQNHLVLDRVYIDILGHKTWHKSRNPAK